MKKLLILPAILFVLGITGCGPVVEEEAIAEPEVIVDEMQVEADALLVEEAAVDAEIMDLETE